VVGKYGRKQWTDVKRRWRGDFGRRVDEIKPKDCEIRRGGVGISEASGSETVRHIPGMTTESKGVL